MGVFDQMRKLTAGKPIEEPVTKAQPGDVITGTIVNIIRGNDHKKGGYGFISSPALPYERIFFHWSGLRQDTLRYPDLKRRMRVEFELKHDDHNGYIAIKIKVLN